MAQSLGIPESLRPRKCRFHPRPGRWTGGIALLLAGWACSRPDRPSDSPPVPAEVSLEQFQALRWLQGTWRGTQSGANPFFESYVFLNDSTIRRFNYPDSTFAEATDSGMIAWSRGNVTSAAGSPAWIATRFDSATVRFDPLRDANNSFTWTRLSNTEWTALLQWSDESGNMKERLYRMERVGS